MGAVEESIQLENKILSNKISKKQLVKEIESIEKKYGEDAFLPYNLVKKEKPWGKDYYNELVLLGNAGACSKEFLLHIIEVRDYLKTRTKIIAAISALVSLVVVGAIIACLL